MRKFFVLAMLITIFFVVACAPTASDQSAPTAAPTKSASPKHSVHAISTPAIQQSNGSPNGEDAAAGSVEISFTYNSRSGMASNQFAVWIEDVNGTFIKSLFATSFTADGGWEKREYSLPVWVERSGVFSGASVDGVSGATPKSGPQQYRWDCTDADGNPVPKSEYHFFVEGTIYQEADALFSGTIDIVDGETRAEATAEYTNSEAEQSDMIEGVTAIYIP